MQQAAPLDTTVGLRVGDRVSLVRAGSAEPETYIVTVICPTYPPSPPVGRSLLTGISRVLHPFNQDEAFFRAAA
ncbi:MAG TPA: hypothetical protein VJM83_04090 [Nitrospirota bacterium]|nr:hypothetical protein [Nitrospirota bacterium]